MENKNEHGRSIPIFGGDPVVNDLVAAWAQADRMSIQIALLAYSIHFESGAAGRAPTVLLC